jgi:anti-sigma factor RsiW
MAEQHPTEAEQLQEELTAYLDGELDANEVRRVEERLARDAVYRAELQRLERTWNLLDRLPRATVDEDFTKSTIEMVAVAASQEALAVQSSLPQRQQRRRLIGLAGLAAAALVGFVAGHLIWPSPNQALLRDLPVLENLDRYYQADNLEFLQALEHEGLFVEGDDHAG